MVSPSGNFYGSEQVLFDYLKHTSGEYEVFVPAGSTFHGLLSDSRHKIYGFSGVKQLYLRIFWKLLTGSYAAVYVNEAGHSRYVQFLAGFFPKVRFIIHVRILEDTSDGHWGSLRHRNTTLVSISKFVKQRLKPESVLVYDLFDFPDRIPVREALVGDILDVAIVGRVSYTKGFSDLVGLAREIEAQQVGDKLRLNIYGDISSDVIADSGLAYLQKLSFVQFHGFVSGDKIYRQNCVVLHLSKVEPLGRIFFEAVSAGLPLIGFKSGGIGEIFEIAGLEDFAVSPGREESRDILCKLRGVQTSVGSEMQLRSALERMKLVFGRDQYVSAIDSLLMGNGY